MKRRSPNRRSFLRSLVGALAAPFVSLRASVLSSSFSRSTALTLTDPSIVITKRKRRLQLFSRGDLVKTYRIGLGLSPVEDKIRAGDRRTPEGEFYICLKNSHSQFYLSLGLSYPNQKHAERGLRDRLITRAQYNQIIAALNRRRMPPQNTRLGGELFIHGSGSASDWTWGCVALDNKDIQELFNAAPLGTPVNIEH
jgi:murein L,D-transpeptidase YafK